MSGLDLIVLFVGNAILAAISFGVGYSCGESSEALRRHEDEEG